MDKILKFKRLPFFLTSLSIFVNLVFCTTLLPRVIVPGYEFNWVDLGEVFLWQGISQIGWPFALLGGIAGLVLRQELAELPIVLSSLVYPGMLFCLILLFINKQAQWLVLILFQLFLTLSFYLIWDPVLNGYNFMVG